MGQKKDQDQKAETRLGDMRVQTPDSPDAAPLTPEVPAASADAATPPAPEDLSPPPQIRPGEHASVFGVIPAPPLLLSTRAHAVDAEGRAVRKRSSHGLALRQWGRRLRVAISSQHGLVRYALAAASGGLAVLAMAPFHAVPLLIVSFVTLVWLLDGTDRAGKGLRESFAIGWWFGVPFFAGSTFWISNAFLVEAETYAWMIPFAIAGMAMGLALFTGIALLLARMLWRAGPSRVLVFAISFTALELARGMFFTGFPWNVTGYAWGGLIQMMQSVSLFGIYGLGFLTVLAAATPAVLFGHGREKSTWRWPVYAVLAFGAIWTYGAVRLAMAPEGADAFVPGVNLRIVQPNIPQADKILTQNDDAIWQRLVAQSTVVTGSEAPITHVIWPEAGVPIGYAAGRQPWRAMAAAALGGDTVLITGTQRWERGTDQAYHFYNSFGVVDGGGTMVSSYDKHHLVPFGEYLPFRSLLEALGFRQLVELREGNVRPMEGPGPRTLSVPGAPDIGPLICYEAIFPGEVVDPRRRPGWLVNVTDDSWFGDTTGPRQHLGFAQARAIEEGLPLIRAANTGISAVIDSRGRILEQLPINTMGVINSPLPVAESPTLYSRVGNWPVIVLILAGLAWGWAGRRHF